MYRQTILCTLMLFMLGGAFAGPLTARNTPAVNSNRENALYEAISNYQQEVANTAAAERLATEQGSKQGSLRQFKADYGRATASKKKIDTAHAQGFPRSFREVITVRAPSRNSNDENALYQAQYQYQLGIVNYWGRLLRDIETGRSSGNYSATRSNYYRAKEALNRLVAAQNLGYRS